MTADELILSTDCWAHFGGEKTRKIGHCNALLLFQILDIATPIESIRLEDDAYYKHFRSPGEQLTPRMELRPGGGPGVARSLILGPGFTASNTPSGSNFDEDDPHHRDFYHHTPLKISPDRFVRRSQSINDLSQLKL